MIQVVFTAGDSLMSKIIRGITGEPVSHCAILVGDYVLHSNLLGTQVDSIEKFQKHSKILFQAELEEALDMTERLESVVTKRKHSFYDFGALIFLGTCLFLRAKLGIPLPKSNLWKSTGMYLCTELVTAIVYDREDSMLTPYGLYLKLKEQEGV